MPTYGQVQTRIRGDLNRGSQYDVRIRQAIIDAIQFYQSRRFTFNTKRAEASLTADAEYITLPTDFIEVDYLRIQDNNEYDPLREVTYHWIEDHRRNTAYTSRPEKYAVQNKELRLWPVSDSAYTLTISYVYELSEISQSATDGATNAWTNEAEELVRLHAMSDVLRHRIRGPEAIAEADNLDRRGGKIERVYKTLRRRANRQESTGRLTPWG